MTIAFHRDRWARIREESRRWWAGKLDRPLIHARLWGRDAGRPEPKLPNHHFTAFYGSDVSADAIVDRWDYGLRRETYLGDAFPAIWPNFGPGVMAAFMGAPMVNGKDTVWFHPPGDHEMTDVVFRYEAASPVYHRVQSICRAAGSRWDGLVQVGMTDLGGNLDVLSTFRPSEKLLLDLVDCPEDVKRKTWEAHELWFRYYQELHDVLRPPNPGYTGWTPIFSEEPYYMLQCDFCYMISPAMFDEFVKPELAATCKRLTNPFYHLDGKGQLPHLDSLLSIKELKGVQWIPGDGQPDARHWPDVYRKIRKAGKLIQLWGGPEILDAVAEQIGGAEGIVLIGGGELKHEDAWRACLKKYGVAP
jgi:hypothetical protein